MPGFDRRRTANRVRLTDSAISINIGRASPEEEELMTGQLEKLRDELIEFERIIAEFQKWKLIGIGAVFAAGLSLSEGSDLGGNAALALIAIPMVTVYADFLIRDYDLRLCLIARYMRPLAGEFGDYERFLSESVTKGKHWLFGHVASACSSLAANGAVLWLASTSSVVKAGAKPDVAHILVIGAWVGIALAILTQGTYAWLVSKIFAQTREHGRRRPDLD
jgi:hypothetical protein